MKEDETIEQKKTYEDELLDIDYFDFSKVISEKLENLTFEKVKESKSFRELKKKMKIKAETEELEFQEVVNKIKALGIESEIYKNATQLARTKVDINTRIIDTARHKNTNEKEFLVLLEKYLLEEHLEKDNEKGMKFLITNFEATEEQSNIIEKFDNLSGGIVELCGILETFGLISSEYREEANSIFEEEKKLNEESLEIKREVDKFNSDIIEIREKINSFFIQKNTIVEMLNKSEGIAEIRKQLSSKVIFNDDYYFLFETLSFHFHFILQKDSLQILIEQDEGGKSEEEKIKAFNSKLVEEMTFFNDIKLKTQAVSMYKPTEIIFLEGEDIAKVYKEQAIVTIPFGLKAENENEVTYKITKLNYEQSDKDLRFFNACVSAQWNLIEHKRPINTFIEEATLYQIYIGDTSFTYRPKKEELEKMKNSILGMNSNQARMEFQSSYEFLSEGQRVKYISEGTILPVTYKSIIYEGKNGQKYSKSGYVFSEMIPLFSFMYELKEINSAPLQIESILKSSQMNDEITRILKKEIAQLYFFKNNTRKKKKNIETGFQRRVYVTSNGEELTPNQWGEKSVEYKQQGKVLRGYWKYYTTRKIDSLIKNCKFTKKNGEILHVDSEKNLDRKTYSRFIDSVITFLRESKKIQCANGKNYIKDFILYDKKGNIVKDSDYHTENEKKRLKNKRSTRSQERLKSITSKKNPSIDKIDIIITDS